MVYHAERTCAHCAATLLISVNVERKGDKNRNGMKNFLVFFQNSRKVNLTELVIGIFLKIIFIV